MKKLIFLLLAITFLFNSQIFSQQFEPISFRSQALGGIIYDDLDLVYDPIELRFVEGTRVYTNLSNLINSNELILENGSSNEFLFGISAQNPFLKNLWSSLLIRYSNAQTSPNYWIDRNLDGNDDFTQNGDFQDIYNEYLDNTGDGLYDIRNEINQSKENFTINKRNTIIFNNSYLFQDWTFGLKFINSSISGENTRSSGAIGSGTGSLFAPINNSPSFNLNHNHYLIDINFLDYNRNEMGNFLSENETNQTFIQLSAMKPFKFSFIDTVELRGDLFYLSDKNTMSSDDIYSGREQNFDQDITGYNDFYSESDQNIFLEEWDGSEIGIGLGVKRVFDRASERKNDGFWSVDFALFSGSYDYVMNDKGVFNSNETFFDGADTLQQDDIDIFNNSFIESDKGDESRSRYLASARVNIPLGEYVSTGAGIIMSYESRERTTDYSLINASTQNYTLQDSLTDNDFVQTINSFLTADRFYSLQIYRVRIPIGIEYRFTEDRNWSIRFGSIFEYVKTNTKDKIQITSSNPQEEITEWGDGTSQVNIENNIYESTKNFTRVAQSTTTFVYGLGYHPTENLQIDLLGFLGTTNNEIIDADFYRNWRLSFSLKF